MDPLPPYIPPVGPVPIVTEPFVPVSTTPQVQVIQQAQAATVAAVAAAATSTKPLSHRYTNFETTPKTHRDCVFGGNGVPYRFSVLDSGIIRYEWAEDCQFEDRASTFATNRLGYSIGTEIDVVDDEDRLEIATKRFKLTYDKSQPFSASSLTAQVRGYVSEYNSVWRYGEPQETLGGTCRTLDGVNGRTELEPGIISKNGFVALDDSDSMVFEADGWVGSRRPGKRIDGYLFAFGRDYFSAIQAFWKISGRPPRVPRWALGNWWSRYHPYTANEYIDLVDHFAQGEIPFSVAVLDMDWHLTNIDSSFGSGWTGYTWNRDLFPDPKRFMECIHQRDMRICLNVHPADGIRKFEEGYPPMAYALGYDGHKDIPFDCTNRAFFDAYFDVLHRRLEKEGVDFWWVDWQQGRHCKIRNVDPLWMLNHFHYHDNSFGGKIPLTFSRYAGPGSQRYPVGFSGDTVVSWESLHFQPEFTATASNIGYTWWSHDIGGHWGGIRDDELATRWLQLGVFSPILRLHSSYNKWNRKEPWTFSMEACEIQKFFLQFRHRLIPYIQFYDESIVQLGPLVKPMYWAYPYAAAAYEVPNQFMFAHLIVAPITTPCDPKTKLASVKSWLPRGRFVDIFNVMWYDGDREIILHRPLNSYPVFLPEGGILVLDGAKKPKNGGMMSNNQLLPKYEILLAKPGGKFDHPPVLEGFMKFSWRAPHLDGNPPGIVDAVLLVERSSNEPLERTELPELKFQLLGAGRHDFRVSFNNDQDRVKDFIPLTGPHDFTSSTGDFVIITSELLRKTRGQNINIALKLALGDECVTDCKTNVFTHVERVLGAAQVGHNLKQRIWDAVQAPGSKEVKIGRVASMDYYQPLKDALIEILTADSRSVTDVKVGMEDVGRVLR